MSDILRHAEHIAAAEWTLHDVIDDLRTELAEEHEIIRLIAKERDVLRAQVADLCKDKAGLQMQLDHANESVRFLREHRTRDWAFFWMLIGR